MQERFVNAHMAAAFVYAQLSHCKRRKVGCVIVKDNKIISIGYNGTPAGSSNQCEDEQGKTLDDVIHAEMNAGGKLAADIGGGKDASWFVTRICCIHCAKMIAATQAKDVYYCHEASTGDKEGADYLKQRCNVPVYKVNQPTFPSTAPPLHAKHTKVESWLQQLLTRITRKSDKKNERGLPRNSD